MPDLIHKIKDTITHHHEHHGHHEHHAHTHGKKSESLGSRFGAPRDDLDLNCTPSSTTDPVDITGRHEAEPDQRDLDGRVHPKDRDAPDLTGPHRDGKRVNVDINGRGPSTHNPPDLNSRTADPSSRC
ncbi:hypothetical protein GGR50DRAFT_360929 [Xylaria sp. CBS 124048]|nr:hypothetical protein GGR50DRAFT_360929 [Xylaria sp. CBS 124048]